MTSAVLTLAICTADRASDLAFTLGSLAGLGVPAGRGTQLIFVDNGSTDETAAVLAAASRRLPFPVERLYEPRRGLARARNFALKHARGEVIAWTDDDCVPAEDWVERLLGHFDADPSLDFLTGRVELFDPTPFPITINTSREPATLDEVRAYADFVIGGNMAFRRQLVERIGCFDAR